MRKRMLSILLAMCMMLTMAPAALASSDPACAGDESCAHVAAIGSVHYDTLAEAVEAAQNNDTIELLRTTEGSGIKVTGNEGRNLTIDLNGFTYTVVAPTVGSTGTETNGFQFLKGSTITFQNGTIKPGTSAAKILFQNYSNLTLDNMTVDCSGSGCQYVASNNSGNVLIKDSTLIAANGQAAFDLYYWPSNGYADGVSVTVEGDSVINGRVEYGSDGTATGLANVGEKAILTINSGNFTGNFSTYNLGSSKANITINGGTFSTDVSAYINKNLICTDNGDGTFTVENLNANNAAAAIGTDYYKTLSEALAAAQDGATVTLLKNSVGNTTVKIEDGRSITLDMNGFNAGFLGKNNISIYHGGLNLTGSGKLYEEAPYLAPVVLYGSNNPNDINYTTATVGKDVILEGWAGLFIDQLKANNSGANAFGIVATINGTLHSVRDTDGYGGHALYLQGIIKATEGNVPQINLDGATLTTDSGNGMYLAGYAKTTITDSTINSSAAGNTGIEIRAGELTINGNTTVMGGTGETSIAPNGNGSTTENVALAVVQHTTKLPTSVTINSGTFTGGAALFEQNAQNNDAEAISKINLAVYGGNFNGQIFSQNKTDFISGGYFTDDPSAYLTAQKTAVASDKDGYVFMVTDKGETPAEVIVAQPSIAGPSSDDLNDEEAAIAEEAMGDLADAPVVPAENLFAAAGTIANDNTVTEEQGKTALEDAEIAVNDDTAVTIVIQPYLDIKIMDVQAENDVYSLSLDITPKYVVLATTATDLTNIQTEGANKNAVAIGTAQNLDLSSSIDMSIPLPTGFPTSDLFVKHTHNGKVYIYTGAVKNNVLTFTNPNGFSEFVVTSTNDSVAAVNGIGYTSLQDAVNAASDNATIEILKGSSLTATYNSDKTLSFKNTTENDIEVMLNGTQYKIAAGETSDAIPGSSSSSGGSTGSGGGGGGAATYAVTVPTVSNGTISVSPKNASQNATVTITVNPNAGYALGTLTVKDADGNTVKLTKVSDTAYTFKMPASKVTIEAAFTAQTADNPFTDVAASEYYYDAVLWAVESEITNGMTATTFGPNEDVSRAQMVTFLWRAAGSPEATGTNPFTDVSTSDYYYDAVLWAVTNGVTTGMTATTFGPEEPVSRAQAVTFQWRAAESPAASADSFTDVAADAYYADAVAWAVENEITNGMTATTFGPDVTVTRAQAVTFLYRAA